MPESNSALPSRPEPETCFESKKGANAVSGLRFYLRRLLHPSLWSLRGRFVYASGMLLLAGLFVLILFLARALEKTVEQAALARLDRLESLFKHEIDTTLDRLLKDAAALSSLPGLPEPFAARDDRQLAASVLPFLDHMKRHYTRPSLPYQFYLPGAIPFFNTASLTSPTDDQLLTHFMVSKAEKDAKAESGIELSAAGPVLRAVAPVLRDNAVIGAIETSAAFDDIFPQERLLDSAALLFVTADAAKSLGMKDGQVLPGWMLLKVYGTLSKQNLADILARDIERPYLSGALGSRIFNLQDFSGRRVGCILLLANRNDLARSNQTRLLEFSLLAGAGSFALLLVLFVNVSRLKVFLDKLKRILIASHSNDFAGRFEADPTHCRDVLHCNQSKCPVYNDPSRVCYLETGTEAISPLWRNTCIYLKKYKKCCECPVYRLRHGDELMEMRNVVNTLMRLWGRFLSRIGQLLADVLRARELRSGLPSLDQISEYLEQMARLASFSHDVQGVYDQAEVFRQLEYIFSKQFGLKRFNLLLVNSSENRMDPVLERDLPTSPEVLFNCDLCRAKRVAEEVNSAHNPVICPYISIDTDLDVRTCLPMVMGGRVGAVFSFAVPRAEWERTRSKLSMIKKYLDETAPVLSSLRLLQLTREQALRDPLTRCHNRRFLDEYLSHFEQTSLRYGKKAGFLMLDLDHFKMVNDEFGHIAGDQILQQASALIRENIRHSDLLIRYGGEEFLVLLQEINPGDPVRVGEKIRAAMETTPFQLPNGGRLMKTISVGVAEYPRDADQPYKTIKFADVALYEAKKLGRNKVVEFKPEMWVDDDY